MDEHNVNVDDNSTHIVGDNLFNAIDVEDSDDGGDSDVVYIGITDDGDVVDNGNKLNPNRLCNSLISFSNSLNISE
jgi:hypothetical protein